MKHKDLLLFVIVCGLNGADTLVGSVLGNRLLGVTGLFLGALLEGLVGILAATGLATHLTVIDRAHSAGVCVSGMAGFALASAIAVANLHTPIIPLASLTLVGLGRSPGESIRGSIRVSRTEAAPALIGLALSAPALFFVSAALLKYGLGIAPPFNLLDSLLSNPDRVRVFNLISPFVFLGGLLIATTLNLYPQLKLRLQQNPHQLSALITLEARPINLAVIALGCVLLAVLVGYVALENLTHPGAGT